MAEQPLSDADDDPNCLACPAYLRVQTTQILVDVQWVMLSAMALRTHGARCKNQGRTSPRANDGHDEESRLMAKGAQFMNGLRSRYRPAASRLAFVGVELLLLSAAAANAEAATGGGHGSSAGAEAAVAPDSIRCRRSDGVRPTNDSARGARMAGSLKAEALGPAAALWALRTMLTWLSWKPLAIGCVSKPSSLDGAAQRHEWISLHSRALIRRKCACAEG